MATAPPKAFMEQFCDVMQIQKAELSSIKDLTSCMAGVESLARCRGASIERLAQARFAEMEALKKKHAAAIDKIQRAHSRDIAFKLKIQDKLQMKVTTLDRNLTIYKEESMRLHNIELDSKRDVEEFTSYITYLDHEYNLQMTKERNRILKMEAKQKAMEMEAKQNETEMEAMRMAMREQQAKGSLPSYMKNAIVAFFDSDVSRHEEFVSMAGDMKIKTMGLCVEHAKDFQKKINNRRCLLDKRCDMLRSKAMVVDSPFDPSSVISQLENSSMAAIKDIDEMDIELKEAAEAMTKAMVQIQDRLDEVEKNDLDKEKERLRKMVTLAAVLGLSSEWRYRIDDKDYGDDD
ncbi:hypothetical protein T440DRAFT_38885 [Plenodomus tracheiphilus IPT5]|uniref:Uncharacterized protein n=1 Tax=Plenodomus tracheiphilus IPT5 TaxID=1408161 RepID=A0A6A7BBZ1_9PLEO|nr:hypothetical protein T440DRAFT_38885 [Plenodomus tracheiphilus IPT5]